MLTVVKNYWNFFKKSIKCNLASVLEYKKSFIIQSVFMFFNNAFFLVFWLVLFDASNGSINGITLNDVLYLWSAPTLAYGIAFFFFGGTRNLGKYILEGGLDGFLTQPKNIIINVMLSAMDFAAFGDLMYGLVMGLIAVEFDLFKYIVLIILGIMASIIYICAEVIIRLLTIVVGDTNNIEHLYINTLLINFSTYPEAIYSNAIKFLIYTIIPSAYTAFVPIKFITTFNLKYLLIFFIAVLAMIGLTSLLSKKLLKKYESGNNIALKG